jgi:hypothetical protein
MASWNRRVAGLLLVVLLLLSDSPGLAEGKKKKKKKVSGTPVFSRCCATAVCQKFPVPGADYPARANPA